MPRPQLPDRERIAQDIRDKIVKGKYKPGDKLPPLSELKAIYGTSAEPVRSALLILKTEGVITGRQGKGVYVATPDDRT